MNIRKVVMQSLRAAMSVVVVIGSLRAVPALAAEPMPAGQVNALVQKYCAVCHTDTAKNGGLTLQHFDVATSAPSLAAMLTSKLTGGALLHTAQIAGKDPSAAVYIGERMKGGAMGAAGLGTPDKPTIYAFTDALASRARNADQWYIENGPVVIASIFRELPRPNEAGQGSSYRLIVTCDAATQQGDVQLAWSPMPKRGTFTTLIDGEITVTHKAEGSETMGNGSKVEAGPASLRLFQSRSTAKLPTRSLRISELFPGEAIEFPFDQLSDSARMSLSACFE
jgi:hypothetical protein